MSAGSSPRTDKPRKGLDAYASVPASRGRGRGAWRGGLNFTPSSGRHSGSAMYRPMLAWEHLVGSSVILTTQVNRTWMATLAATGTEGGRSGAILHNARDLNSRSALAQERVFVPVQLIANCIPVDSELVLQQQATVAVDAAETRATLCYPWPSDADTHLLTEPEENNFVGSSHKFMPNEKQHPAQKKQAIVKSEKKKGMVELAASAQTSEQSAWGNNTSLVSYPPHQIASNQYEMRSRPIPPSSYIPVDEQAHTQLNPIVNSMMTSAEIARVLAYHGCTNLTLYPNSRSKFAVSNGGFGEVYSGRLMDGTPVAIKVFRLHFVRESKKHLKRAAKEVYTWSKCQHPNVLRLLGFVEFRGQIGMVSPWMSNGNLQLYLTRWPNTNRYRLCYGISNGLAYLHAAGIIHGDLKGANVLISDDGAPLITDFGNAVLNNQSLQFTNTPTQSITPRWTAPEVLEGSVQLSYPADVYSLAMTLLETMTGRVPYHELLDPAVYVAIVIKKKVPSRPEAHIPTGSKCGDRLWSLLEKCWDIEPEHRPSAEQVRHSMSEIVDLDGIIIPAAIHSAHH